MKNSIVLVVFLLSGITGFSQVKSGWRDGGEMIFSWGNIDQGNLNADNVLRFSLILNEQLQYHVDYGRHTGFYTGLGIRNVGFIHKFGDTLKIKQRVYSFGVPFALKFGNMDKNVFVAVGAEMELFFHFKEKTFLHGEKMKTGEWFSDRTELFHPSVFTELDLGKGFYIRYRYYLTDFLKKKSGAFPGAIQLPHDNSGTLMYISVGTMISKKKAREQLPVIRKASNTYASACIPEASSAKQFK